MIPDRLYDAAFAYKKTQLWKKLYDSQVFAVRHADQTISYCCVMGRAGSLNALACYHGQSGLDSLVTLHGVDPDADELTNLEYMHSQDCMMLTFEGKDDFDDDGYRELSAYCRSHGIQLRGKNACPHFERWMPGLTAWRLEDETEQQYMLDALEAAIEVNRRLKEKGVHDFEIGLMEGELYGGEIALLSRQASGYAWEMHRAPLCISREYPVMPAVDDVTCARLRKANRAGTWAVRVFMLPEPISDEASEQGGMVFYEDMTHPARYHYAMMMTDLDDKMPITMDIAKNEKDYVPEFSEKLLSRMREYGVPTTIEYIDQRTEAFLSEICAQLDIETEVTDSIEELDEFLDELASNEGGGLEGMAEEMDEVFEAIRNPETLRQMPADLLKMTLEVFDNDMFPEDIRQLLRNEVRRRGL